MVLSLSLSLSLCMNICILFEICIAYALLSHSHISGGCTGEYTDDDRDDTNKNALPPMCTCVCIHLCMQQIYRCACTYESSQDDFTACMHAYACVGMRVAMEPLPSYCTQCAYALCSDGNKDNSGRAGQGQICTDISTAMRIAVGCARGYRGCLHV